MRYGMLITLFVTLLLVACGPSTPTAESTAAPAQLAPTAEPAAALPTVSQPGEPLTPTSPVATEQPYPVELPVVAGDGGYPAPPPSGGQAEPYPGTRPTELTAEMQKLVDAATADLSTATGAAADAIALVSLEPITWSDGSLGCPAPDMMYTQALVDGYLLQLETGGQVYDYHTAGTSSFVRCEAGRPASFGTVDGS